MRPRPFKIPHLLLLASFALGTLPMGATRPGVPEVLRVSDPDRTIPGWVAAEAAIDPKGAVTEQLFTPEIAASLQRQLSTPAVEGCIRIEESYQSIVNPPDLSRLENAVEEAELVLTATVTAQGYGFRGDEPGQLLEIQPQWQAKGQIAKEPHYVFFPVGTFTAGPYRICKSDHRFAPPPEIGDEVLLFVAAPYSASDRLLDVWDGNSVVVIKADGKVSLPPRLGKSGLGVSTKAELLQRVRVLLGQEN